ncbi:MAG: DUF4156 domain-containing protein [Gammaproteobacteria bacterium]|nr:DUF4156 domain-containing protein [Gammaproteobacteria bacterium]
MNIQKTRLALLVVITMFVAGCAMVSLTSGGEKIRVLAPDEVSSCRELGKTNTSVTATALGVPRPPETLAKELETIARNSAANMNGDTVVPLTVISEGRQTFVVYKCVNPDG